ncbi:glutamic-type intramembrane protease PrsW [Aureibacillus halotolerans]|uniref:Protease PrsW n=1 Tax=Aureibacillus halotolerans TaxID=1508390 RepID=A0A4R6U7A1_9BACI|nr:glutamic-type intramembrane protease PrsW [Aureibacillus halotolerans]TDQ41552.1 RsiW-degrading membrane proteinase PrsW (M82 family) [Aureibacillus halotolerans]
MLPIISAGVAPGAALLCYFYLHDKYESEPFSLVFKMFITGLLIVFPIMFLQYTMHHEIIISSHVFEAFVETALLEEFSKWFVLYYMIYRHVEFDDYYDGIVYGVAVSLGFATLENILYLFANGLDTAFGRALLPVSSHALYGVIMGYYLGRARFKTKASKMPWLLMSFMIPFLLHGVYDLIILSFADNWMMMMIPFMTFLWWLGLKKVKLANRRSRKRNLVFMNQSKRFKDPPA